ncbi:MAG: aminopeptidase P N-terminal domain-containing protein [Bacteroidales bacterium]|nr:aminopeptidase P N-terminal domain-containing protein [Bacteroidales bacterium]
MNNNSIAILFSASTKYRNASHEYKYRQCSNIIYLTGILDPIHAVVLTKDSYGNCQEYIFLPTLDEKTIIYQGIGISPDEVKKISGIEQIHYSNELLNQLLQAFDNIYIVKSNMNHLFDSLLFHNNSKNIIDLSPILQELRLTKEPEEIAFIKKAIRITGEAFNELLKNFNHFKTEADIEAFITSYFISKGQYQHAYLPIIASGANALTLHYTNNSGRLLKNKLTLLDFGCEYKGYASDLSRTIPNKGIFTKRQKEIYNKVLSILKEVQKNITPGTSIKELNILSKQLMEKALVELKLLTVSDIKTESTPLVKKYFPHGVSHFMGLDVHDSGNTETILQEGMILSCEPGIYIPEENIGIRLENDILVAPTPINLMQHIPIEIDEIEYRMN